MSDVQGLERRARELARRRDYGDESLRLNQELVRLAPSASAPRTRLGCCHEAAGDLLGALRQYELALELEPANSVARGLIARLQLRLHFPGVPMPASLTGPAPAQFRGFSLADFAELASTTSQEQALERFGPRFDDLARHLNGLPVVSSIQEIRGESGGLFRANTLWQQPGHLYTYHWGGRWTAQYNIGIYSANSSVGSNLARIGAGFNMTLAGRDPEAARKLPALLRRFASAQEALSGQLGRDLLRCLGQPRWGLQFGDDKPDLDGAPEAALSRLRGANGANVRWVFIGRWLSPNQPDDATVLEDRKAFLAAVDHVFRQLLPLLRAAA